MAIPTQTAPRQGDTTTVAALKSLSVLAGKNPPAPPAGSGLTTLAPTAGDTIVTALKKICALLGLGAGVGGGGGGLINYSLTEQWTGELWIDGAKVYQKTVSLGPTATGPIPHNIANVANFLRFYGEANNGTNWVALPYVDAVTPANSINIYLTASNVQIISATFTTWIGYVTLFYTCTDR